MKMQTLLLVDLQNDFLPKGALAVKDGDRIIPLVNEMIHYPFDLIVTTKDWHPADHGSFASNHQKKTGQHVKLAGIDQILWPDHCIQGTKGADYAPNWDTTKIDHVVYKGTDPSIDSYSAFFDNRHFKSTGLDDYLKSKNAKILYIAGLATDYCVRYTVLDAIQLGYIPYVIIDACRAVNLKPSDEHEALESMQLAGARLIYFKDLKSTLSEQAKKIE